MQISIKGVEEKEQEVSERYLYKTWIDKLDSDVVDQIKLDKEIDKVFKEKVTKDTLNKFIDDKLKNAKAINIDMLYLFIQRRQMVQYEQEYGFSVKTNYIHKFNKSSEQFAVVLFCKEPTFYTSQTDDTHINVNKIIPFDSPKSSLQFDDPLYDYIDIENEKHQFIIFDVWTIERSFFSDKQNEIREGWCVLPIFIPGKNHVDSGFHQLPLIKGQLNQNIIKKLQNAPNIWDYIHSDGDTFEKNQSFLIVTLVDKKLEYLTNNFKTLPIISDAVVSSRKHLDRDDIKEFDNYSKISYKKETFEKTMEEKQQFIFKKLRLNKFLPQEDKENQEKK